MPRLTDYTTYADAQRHFSADKLGELCDGSRDRLNIAHECVDRHAVGRERTAVTVAYADGHDESLSYAEIARIIAVRAPPARAPRTRTTYPIHRCKIAWQLIDAHPGVGIKNRFGIPDCPERVHWEEEFALQVGVPGAYDYGPERCSWLTHQLTNWMGDDGFLRRATCNIRRRNPRGDMLFINGKVKRKFVEDGRHLIEIGQEAHNQDKELSVIGTCVVELPKRR
ncbi:MAG: hypothetical protein ABJA83_02675 [Burkholderiaceae bacterium]